MYSDIYTVIIFIIVNYSQTIQFDWNNTTIECAECAKFVIITEYVKQRVFQLHIRQ